MNDLNHINGALRDCIGCDEVSSYKHATDSNATIQIVFNVVIESSDHNPALIIKKIKDRLDSSIYFEQARYKDLQTISEQNDYITRLELERTELQRYKTFYELYKGLKDA